jgi:hypothetical protein
MSNRYWKEYGDLYKKAQKTGQYKMFLFDVVGSRKLYADNPVLLNNNLVKFTDSVTKDLLKLEKVLNKKILHRHLEDSSNYNVENDKDKVILCKRQRADYPTEFYRSDSINPHFGLGDMIYFIIERGSIADKTFYEIFEKNHKAIIPNYEFYHKAGYYETDVWAESDTKFSRIYCIPILEYLCKQDKNLIVTNEKEEDFIK